MIGLVHHLKIYACTQPTDMRKGFDGLSGIVAHLLAEEGTFQFPTDLVKDPSPSGKAQITPNQLALLLGGVELSTVRHRKRYALPDIKK
jgi:hypothetical protein